MLTCYHHWIYENHKIISVEILREWVIQETEFQTNVIYRLTKNLIQGVTQEKYLTPFWYVSRIRILDQNHQQHIEIVSYICTASHMEFRLVLNLKGWKYPKDGSMLRN